MSNKDKYRLLCNTEKNIPIFSHDWWLDTVCGERKWDVLLIEQKGRIQAKSVINCSYKYEDIQQAIKIACSQEFILLLENVVNPYEKDSTAKKIFDTINKYFDEGNISIVKKFYDLPYINM